LPKPSVCTNCAPIIARMQAKIQELRVTNQSLRKQLAELRKAAQ
jgi:hypothetical protein